MERGLSQRRRALAPPDRCSASRARSAWSSANGQRAAAAQTKPATNNCKDPVRQDDSEADDDKAGSSEQGRDGHSRRDRGARSDPGRSSHTRRKLPGHDPAEDRDRTRTMDRECQRGPHRLICKRHRQATKQRCMPPSPLPWSNGQIEAQITKLKLVKRQMYGRAKIDLLQARLIGALNRSSSRLRQSPFWMPIWGPDQRRLTAGFPHQLNEYVEKDGSGWGRGHRVKFHNWRSSWDGLLEHASGERRHALRYRIRIWCL